MRRLAATSLLAAAALATLGAVGCGEGAGISEGAAVSVYASAPRCPAAKRELARIGEEAGRVRLRVRCLAPAEAGDRLDLAQVGANARRATEDSTTVAYVAEPDPTAARISRAILAEAGISQLDRPGAAAIRRVARAIRGAAEGESLREAVP